MEWIAGTLLFMVTFFSSHTVTHSHTQTHTCRDTPYTHLAFATFQDLSQGVPSRTSPHSFLDTLLMPIVCINYTLPHS